MLFDVVERFLNSYVDVPSNARFWKSRARTKHRRKMLPSGATYQSLLRVIIFDTYLSICFR